MFYINDSRLEISRTFSNTFTHLTFKRLSFLGSSSFGFFLFFFFLVVFLIIFTFYLRSHYEADWVGVGALFPERRGLIRPALSVLGNCFSTRFWTAIKPWCTEVRSPHNTGCKERLIIIIVVKHSVTVVWLLSLFLTDDDDDNDLSLYYIGSSSVCLDQWCVCVFTAVSDVLIFKYLCFVYCWKSFL